MTIISYYVSFVRNIIGILTIILFANLPANASPTCIFNTYTNSYLATFGTDKIGLYSNCYQGEKWEIKTDCIYNPYLNKYLATFGTDTVGLHEQCQEGEKWVIQGNCIYNPYLNKYLATFEGNKVGLHESCQQGERWQQETANFVTTAVNKRCLISWEDSHQPHTLTKWKKLFHCYELRTTTPVSIQTVAKQYVEECVNHALNSNKTKHIVTLIIAIVADVHGTAGAAITAAVGNYIDAVVDELGTCLTDTSQIETHIKNNLPNIVGAEVKPISYWVYWNL